MRNLFFFFCFSVSIFAASAQDSTNFPRGYFQFVAGASIPFGDYKSTDFYSDEAAYAKTGYGFTIGLGYVFGKRKTAGISMHGGLQVNPVNENGIESQLWQRFGGTSFNLSAGRHTHIPVTIGLLALPVLKKSTIAFFVEGGAIFSTLPELRVFTTGYWAIQQKAFSAGWAFSAGCSPNIFITKTLAISPYFQYYRARVNFNNVKLTYSNPALDESINVREDMQVLFFGVGVTLKF